MIWQDDIHPTLDEFSSRSSMPDDLELHPRLEEALHTVQDHSVRRSSRTLGAARALTETAICSMVDDLGATVKDPYSSQISGVGNLWQDRTTLSNTSLHNRLSRVAAYYQPPALREGLEPRLYPALSCASTLLECTYPTDYDDPSNPNAEPLPTDMLHVLSNFAVVSQVHREICGDVRNDTAIAEVAGMIESGADS